MGRGSAHRARSVWLLGVCALLALPACEKRAPGPLLAALLTVAREAGTRVDDGEMTAELGLLARRVSAAREKTDSDAGALAQAVFTESAFVREITSTDLRYVLLPPVLADRKGSCVGLGTLYLALGEQLGMGLEGVVVPGHFFVRTRTRDGQVRNLELLRQGEVMPDSFYRDKYLVDRAAAPAHLRALSPKEIAGVVRFNVGNERRRAGRLAEAAKFYRQAAADFPQFGEAHASLGLVLQLQGDRAGARAAYQEAARVEPNLPGLDRNISLLEQEMSGQRPSENPPAAPPQ